MRLPPYVVMQSEESRDSLSIGEMRTRNGMPSSEKPILGVLMIVG